MSSSPDPTSSDEPASAQVKADPYSVPQADIRLAPTEPSMAIPSATKSAMGIGIVLCSGWPLYFGTMISSHSGRWGMVLTYVVVALLTLGLLRAQARRFTALANGLLVLGVLSLIPFIPVVVGGLWIGVVGSLFHHHQRTGEFLAISLITLLYSLSYIVVAFFFGSLLLELRGTNAPRRSSAARRTTPTQPPSAS